ncbi:hypothetical protein LOC68_24035 [Blastopirellula sp. JC732]|uniref:Uncharacterized protein n=1 Tax=Blastopirellula sediminis TaxID=2894196 RepID=A0A9X1MSV5_9BACT|nr:hypothetical protein [Blastopirellula sediminis]MCC9605223.1 hypothetical protein [Blastopirellula sediminis]MCC9631477.1 hypothetical protein [Blastopirellula sediminis]
MPKALTITGMAISILIFLVFALDLAIGVPFQGVSATMDIAFVVGSAILAFLAFTTFRELK